MPTTYPRIRQLEYRGALRLMDTQTSQVVSLFLSVLVALYNYPSYLVGGAWCRSCQIFVENQKGGLFLSFSCASNCEDRILAGTFPEGTDMPRTASN